MDRTQLLSLLDVPQINRQLKQLDEFLEDYVADCPGLFFELVARTVREGKRLRPTMVVLAAQTGRRSSNVSILKAAASVELIHKASLLHDSAFDDGLASKQAAISVLAGDYLLGKAMHLAAGVEATVARELAGCVVAMVEGETIQAMPGYKSDPGGDKYIDCVTKKTASLFVGGCLIGGRLGGLGQSDLNKLKDYGHFFGIAFQMIDDINDGEFAAEYLPAAKKVAEHNMDLAARRITGMKDNPAKAALLQIADLYLPAALS